MRTIGLVCALLLSSCGGASSPSASPVSPYPGDDVVGPVPPYSPPMPPDAPGLVVAAQFATPNDRFGVWNMTGVPLDAVGFSREGEFIPGLGHLADHGDYLGLPWEWIQPGEAWETLVTGHRPYDTPHVGIASDVLGRRYEALYVPRPGARGWIVTPEMLVTP